MIVTTGGGEMGFYKVAISLFFTMTVINLAFSAIYAIFPAAFVEQQYSTFEISTTDTNAEIKAADVISFFLKNQLLGNKEIWDILGFNNILLIAGYPFLNLSTLISAATVTIYSLAVAEFVRGRY